MLRNFHPPLPIDAVLDAVCAALAAAPGAAVLEAEPGAGKTTRVPLALLDADWLAGGKVLLLEPRRLAARAAAARLAAQLGEAVGETVGYRIRNDTKVGPRTRIEVVTEGILTRRLQHDPELAGVGLVIFDEFHERSLHADLGLALTLDVRATLREELRILVMSATLDGAAVAALLGGEAGPAPQIASAGRCFPVATRYLDAAEAARVQAEPVWRVGSQVVGLVRRALAEETGSVLVFLPGAGEIRDVAGMLAANPPPPGPDGTPVDVMPLYGNLDRDAQDAAIAPAPPGRRKVVLATSIAETSLTIEGIRVVVDAGLERGPLFSPATGMSRLETLPASRASADQRRGRAGRLEPGVCYRLWAEAAHSQRPAYSPPEILRTDLAPLVLELAAWGVTDRTAVQCLDLPPAASWGGAVALLQELGALGADARVTPHGRELLTLGVHPRLGHMMLRAKAKGHGSLACDLAALLEERDLLRLDARWHDCDLRLRVEALRSGHAALQGGQVDNALRPQIRQSAAQFRERLGVRADNGGDAEMTGMLVALAYPDRIAEQRGSGGRFRLSNGRGAFFKFPQPLSDAPFLVVPELDGVGAEGRIWRAAPIDRADLELVLADRIVAADSVEWDAREGAVQARRQRRIGAVVLSDAPLREPDPAAVRAALFVGIRGAGLGCLPWSKDLNAWRERVLWVRRASGDPAWPDLGDEALLATLPDWLAPWVDGMTRLAHLQRLNLRAALDALLPWDLRQRLDRDAPTHITVPTGSSIRLDYSGDIPVLAVRIQELYGLPATPRLAGGRVPILLHLLSPGHRPVQITDDLASFWANTYEQVRKDLRGRYPKHFWPDLPATATPTRHTRARMEREQGPPPS